MERLITTTPSTELLADLRQLQAMMAREVDVFFLNPSPRIRASAQREARRILKETMRVQRAINQR